MENKKVVLVGGCFDLLHYGHISFLKRAKNLGDRLVVLLESDESVRRKKGDARPIHKQVQRKEMLESLSYVDEVIPLPPLHGYNEYLEIVDKIHPAVIAVTEGDPKIEQKQLQADKVMAKLAIIPKIHTPSTASWQNFWVSNNSMKILSIETSCDETAAAVVEDGTKILGSAVASSTAMHEKYGGIVPEVAAREQLKCILPVIKRCS